jgi:hypothetical protein
MSPANWEMADRITYEELWGIVPRMVEVAVKWPVIVADHPELFVWDKTYPTSTFSKISMAVRSLMLYIYYSF